MPAPIRRTGNATVPVAAPAPAAPLKTPSPARAPEPVDDEVATAYKMPNLLEAADLEAFNLQFSGKFDTRVSKDKEGKPITYVVGKTHLCTPSGAAVVGKKNNPLRATVLMKNVFFPQGIESKPGTNGKGEPYVKHTAQIRFKRDDPEHMLLTDNWYKYVDGVGIKLVFDNRKEYQLLTFTPKNSGAWKTSIFRPLDENGTPDEDGNLPEDESRARGCYVQLYSFPENKEKKMPASKTEFYVPGDETPVPWEALATKAFYGDAYVRIDEIRAAAGEVRYTLMLDHVILTSDPMEPEVRKSFRAADSMQYASKNSAKSAALQGAWSKYLGASKGGAGSAGHAPASEPTGSADADLDARMHAMYSA